MLNPNTANPTFLDGCWIFLLNIMDENIKKPLEIK